MICEIKAFGRIHASLIDLSEDGYRLNGGVGWAIDGVHLSIRAAPSDSTEIADRREYPLPAQELAALTNLLTQFMTERGAGGAYVEIAGDLPPHRGLGAGTALRLGVIEAAAAARDVKVTQTEIVRSSGRGGTSGIGVRAYFEGGLVVDLGHRRHGPAAPSRDRAAAGAALPLLRIDMPPWPMGLAQAPGLPAVDIATERRVFAEALPLPKSDVQRVLYEIVFGMVAGVLDNDPTTFAAAIDALQLGDWKRAEWCIHGKRLHDLADRIRALGARGLGLSSMGPTLYFLGDLQNSGIGGGLDAVQWTLPRNTGRELSFA